jgi:hypothetical protein
MISQILPKEELFEQVAMAPTSHLLLDCTRAKNLMKADKHFKEGGDHTVSPL